MNPEDVTFEIAYPRAKGGQSVGLSRPDIKATHLPSGNVVIVGSERSQFRNKQLALSMLEWMELEIRG